MSVPSVLPAPAAPREHSAFIDVPLAWVFLPEEPAPTGSAPEVIVGAVLPCFYRERLGTVSPPETSPLAVRLAAMFQGTGTPSLELPCPQRPVAVRAISLQVLRLGTFAVTDATPHGPRDGAAPAATLHVVPDDATLPSPTARRVRACTPDDDATCTGGGACGEVPGRPGVGVCAPPLDPYLAAGRTCPAGTLAVRLGRARPFGFAAAPEVGAFRACLPACDSSTPCGAPRVCAPIDGGSVCVPR